jgi:hypothetical protein
MLNEESVRIKLERLEVLLDEKFKLISKSISDRVSMLDINDMHTDAAILQGKILGIKEVLEEK